MTEDAGSRLTAKQDWRMRSFPHIPFVALEPVLPEKLANLILIADTAVVGLLAADVPHHAIDGGAAHAEGSESLLPVKVRASQPGFMHPLRRVRLDRSNEIGEGHGRAHVDEQVNVIGHASDLDAAAADVLDDSAEVSTALRRELVIQEWPALLRAEDDVHEEGCESVSHAMPPLSEPTSVQQDRDGSR